MTLVIVTHIGNSDAFHHGADVLGALGNEQVNVIVHQAISMDIAIGRQWLAVAVFRSRDRTEYLEELATVLVVGEDVAAVDTAQHYVVNTCDTMLSAGSGHGQRMISFAKIMRFIEMGTFLSENYGESGGVGASLGRVFVMATLRFCIKRTRPS